MVQFETKVCKSWKGRPKLVIRSTHHVVGGVWRNMFSCNNAGNPMLDVADAIELRGLLDEFIKDQTRKFHTDESEG